jgi:hypothetical protein
MASAPLRAQTTSPIIPFAPVCPQVFHSTSGGGLEGLAPFTLSRTRAFFSATVVLPLQLDEVIREALDSPAGLGGELVGCRIINRSCCSQDLVSAA